MGGGTASSTNSLGQRLETIKELQLYRDFNSPSYGRGTLFKDKKGRLRVVKSVNFQDHDANDLLTEEIGRYQAMASAANPYVAKILEFKGM